ncbi:PTS system, cellobiose-specific IIC component [Bifidobacterium dolichotidis]|uniref:PTS system, cellobiose-specific IIC component n=1 Tax=Bifidobacterium dolichotidis TaxID=2306976 RepID=A0A430FTH4_9BIFI|nr:PTS transporter subunit EIIC [Bifidobacterium dolichotidis]RSX56186.1 PTS system, cellobiose-specific IIC component [Bifidobacterium dolichotidis]
MTHNIFMTFLADKLAPFGEKVAKQRHLKALREGVLMAMPLVLIGSIFTLIGSFPIEAWTKWMQEHGHLDTTLNTLANNSFGLIALVTCFGIAYRLAESYDTDGPSSGVLALGAFLLVTPPIQNKDGAFGIPYGMLGGKGLFTAIVVAFISAEIYRQFIQHKFTIKMPKSVPDVVGRSFAALVPGTVILVLFAVISRILEATGIGSLNNLLALIVGTPLGFIGATLGGTFVAVLLNSVFWFCGVNGGQVVGSVMNPIWLQQADENRLALQAGQALPNIITAPFMDLFVYMGGGGATIGLAICLMFFSKSKEYKVLGKVSGIPALFNINTAILFSFPTVLNPIMIIPFICTPLINALLTYLSMAWGLVPLTTGVALPWTTPPILGGFLACGGSWQAAILQTILVIISFAIYYPFFRAADRAHLKIEQGLVGASEGNDQVDAELEAIEESVETPAVESKQDAATATATSVVTDAATKTAAETSTVKHEEREQTTKPANAHSDKKGN